ncbi:MAG: type III pantothenate kinase [Tunicatimonas sp.]
MHLAIDMGNTRIKAALFDGARQQQAYQLSHWSALLAVADEHSVTRAIVSSVGPLRAVQALGRRLPIPLLVLDSATPLPFAEAYESLGADRRAAVAGAQQQYPQRNALVIDAGTCITYDLIDRRGHYRGGLISPGVQMRQRAMHTFTARLPLVTHNEAPFCLTERSTPAALRSGAAGGAAAEITQMIRMYGNKFSDLQVLLTGGDATYLTTIIPPDHPLAVVPNLILIGLNCILHHHVQQNS